MTALEIIALKIDAYAGAAPDVRPAIGGITVPLHLLAELRAALQGGPR